MDHQTVSAAQSLEGLGHLVQENLFDLFRAMAAVLPGGEVVESQRLSYHHTPPHKPHVQRSVGHTPDRR